MSRPIILTLTLAIIICSVVFSGCIGDTARSTITGNVSNGQDRYSSISGVLIRAIPADGSHPINVVSDDNGNYSLDVKPGVRYGLTGMFYDSYGQYASVVFYKNDNFCEDITLAPGETVALNTLVYKVHPPMSFFMTLDPITGYLNDSFTPSTPVSISGHVYLDGKAVTGASVEAVSANGYNMTSNFTNASGVYILGLGSKLQYNVTATYHGLRHTIWPILLYDNETGVYDINLTRTPTSTIMGIAQGNEGWLQHPGITTIEAVPVNGGTPITAISGNDTSYSLDVEPIVYYTVSGKFRGSDGNLYNASFAYRTGVFCSGFMLRSNETALIDYFTPESYAYLETVKPD